MQRAKFARLIPNNIAPAGNLMVLENGKLVPPNRPSRRMLMSHLGTYYGTIGDLTMTPARRPSRFALSETTDTPGSPLRPCWAPKFHPGTLSVRAQHRHPGRYIEAAVAAGRSGAQEGVRSLAWRIPVWVPAERATAARSTGNRVYELGRRDGEDDRCPPDDGRPCSLAPPTTTPPLPDALNRGELDGKHLPWLGP